MPPGITHHLFAAGCSCCGAALCRSYVCGIVHARCLFFWVGTVKGRGSQTLHTPGSTATMPSSRR